MYWGGTRFDSRSEYRLLWQDFREFSDFLQKYSEMPYFSLHSVLGSSFVNHYMVFYISPKNETWTICAVCRIPYISPLIFVTLLHISTFRSSLGCETNTTSQNQYPHCSYRAPSVVSYFILGHKFYWFCFFAIYFFEQLLTLNYIHVYVLFCFVKQLFKYEVLLHKAF